MDSVDAQSPNSPDILITEESGLFSKKCQSYV